MTKIIEMEELSDPEIDSIIRDVKIELDKRMEIFRGNRPFPELKGKTTIIVDDGLASICHRLRKNLTAVYGINCVMGMVVGLKK